MSYRANFEAIPSLDAIARQSAFFHRMRGRLDGIQRRALSNDVRYQVDALRYEVAFHLDRLALEQKFRSGAARARLPEDVLFRVPSGGAWCRL